MDSEPVSCTSELLPFLGRTQCRTHSVASRCQLIAVTGGPGSGKTAVLNILKNLLCPHTAFLPEAATVIFSGGFWRLPTEVGLKGAQTAIFHVQSQLEAIVLAQPNIDIGLCDRGTVDGVAYWPHGDRDYWQAMGTTREQQILRYHSVIHLRTPGAEKGFNHSNPMRIETAGNASLIDERIYQAWEGHPNRIVIEAETDFRNKSDQAVSVVMKIIGSLRTSTESI